MLKNVRVWAKTTENWFDCCHLSYVIWLWSSRKHEHWQLVRSKLNREKSQIVAWNLKKKKYRFSCWGIIYFYLYSVPFFRPSTVIGQVTQRFLEKVWVVFFIICSCYEEKSFGDDSKHGSCICYVQENLDSNSYYRDGRRHKTHSKSSPGVLVERKGNWEFANWHILAVCFFILVHVWCLFFSHQMEITSFSDSWYYADLYFIYKKHG